MRRTTHSVGAYSPTSYSRIYKVWASMFQRCYSHEFHLKEPSYIGCIVCEEWHDFQNFARFYDTSPYREDGWHLDKDILHKGNKLYAPDMCVFVPPEINKLFVRRTNHRGDTPQGVHYEKRRNRYKASMHDGTGKTVFLGRYRTIEEAFDAYKKAKEARICAVAEKYKGRISPDLYQAMINYKIDMTD
ncbi:MAG: hypothetical protein J6J10_09480 [Alistipes sp.]|nr:hypothetical protein [Alistipes sp.]